MENEYGYPVKYAVLPLYDVIGRDNFGYKNYEIVAFIVSKVYLLGKTLIYKNDGSFENKYVVFYPYMSNDEIIRNDRQQINYNNMQEWNQNQYIKNVSAVFDTYEKAKEEAEIYNEKFFKYSEDYLEIEQKLLEITSDMQIPKEKINDKVKLKSRF